MSALEEPTLPNSDAASNRITHLKSVIARDLGIESSLIQDADAILVARVSEIVGERGCRLSACAMAAVAVQAGFTKAGNQEKILFGLDGSLVEYYPRFEARIRGKQIT